MIFQVLLAHPHLSSEGKSRAVHPAERFRTMFQPSSTACWVCDLAGLTSLSPSSREGALGWSNDGACYFWMPLRKTRPYLYSPGTSLRKEASLSFIILECLQGGRYSLSLSYMLTLSSFQGMFAVQSFLTRAFQCLCSEEPDCVGQEMWGELSPNNSKT